MPQRFGKFEILRELGSGGFGVVYLAIDSILGRQVALKFPRHSILADPESRRRFFREAQALARLDHPHIVPAYEAGEHEGTCYLAVAYCDGPTLQEWQAHQQGPIEPKTAAQIVLCLAEAVEHAHQHDILHRDIKPANVLLSAAPPGGEPSLVPRLVDFGLARIADGERIGITVSGAVLGTPQYLAPEQAAGMNECVGRATDVYGLGAVLYELLTGQPPICGTNTTDTLRRILMDKPVPPSRLNRAVPSLLNNIVMKCLAKSTTSRYGTARELAAALRQFLAERPQRAGSERAWMTGVNPLVRWCLALSLIALMLAGMGSMFWTRRDSAEMNRGGSVTKKPKTTPADSDAGIASVKMPAASSDVDNPPALGLGPDGRAVVTTIIPASAANKEAPWPNGSPYPFNLPANNVSNMRYQQIYARSEFQHAGNITAIRFRRDEGEPPFHSSGIDLTVRLAYAETTVATLSPTFAANVGPGVTTVLSSRGFRLSSVQNSAPQAFDIFLPLSTPFHYDPSRGDLLLDITMRNSIGTMHFDFAKGSDQATTRRVYAVRGNGSEGYIDSRPDVDAGLVTRFDIVPGKLGSSAEDGGASLDRSTIISEIGPALRANEHLALKEFSQAEPILRQVWDQQMQTHGPAHLETIKAESQLGACLAQLGHYAEAEAHLIASHDQLAALANAPVPWLRVFRARVAQLYRDWGKNEEAHVWLGHWAIARRLEIAAMPTDDGERAIGLYRLSLHLMGYKNLAAAELALRECVTLRQRAFGPRERYTASTENFLGECLHQQGRLKEAEEVLLRSYDALAAGQDVPLSWIARGSERLAALYRDLKDTHESQKWRQKWIEIKRKEIAGLPADSAPLSTALMRFGNSLMDHGEPTVAEEVFRDWLALRERVLPGHWTVDHARFCVGSALLAQGNYAQAEPLLLAGYQGLSDKREALSQKELPAKAIERLIELYSSWGRPDEAEKWRTASGASK